MKKFKFGIWLSDQISSFGGSWSYIIYFLSASAIYMLFNSFSQRHFDPYPFQFLNLALGFMASLQAPFILMADNRQSEKDRKQANMDLKIDSESKKILIELRKDLNEMKSKILPKDL